MRQEEEERMAKNGRYRATFRQQEREKITNWVQAGASGSVVGLAGAGKSNLLFFLCEHHQMQPQSGLGGRDVVFVSVDLNDLPEKSLATLYRVILRAFYERRRYFKEAMQETISNWYRENRTILDAFVLQSALRELLLQLREQSMQVVLILDRFDDFCKDASPHMTNTLKGLRDNFKQSLCYIVGMRQAAAYLPTPEMLGELHELVDSHICWVGPMCREDTLYMLNQQAQQAGQQLSAAQAEHLWQLTGGYPSFVRVAGDWWRFEGYQLDDMEDWNSWLLNHTSMQHRLQEVWDGLPSDEQALLSVIQYYQAKVSGEGRGKEAREALDALATRNEHLVYLLQDKGLLKEDLQLFSLLFAAYIGDAVQQGHEAITLNEETGEIYQGLRPLRNLSALERSLLTCLLNNPRKQLTKTELITNAWPDEMHRNNGVTDESLYQVIAGLRRKIEPSRSNPRYIINWRGTPEGGYQFFPDGQHDEG